jgi:GTP-binding protein Era
MATDPSSASGPQRVGTVAIAGPPNAGKSTLFNALMGMKLAIVTPRPQTTRNRIAGIKTIPGAQFVFVDTPGIHQAERALNRRLVATARRAVAEADAVLFLVDAQAGIGRGEHGIARGLAESGTPVVVVLNKMDLIARPRLLPLMETVARLLPDAEIVPVSALKCENLDTLQQVLQKLLPHGAPLHREDELTDQTERFIAQERIREKVFQLTHAEVPYAAAVVVEEFRERSTGDGSPLIHIQATVLIGRPAHKPIVIGEGGRRLKEIGRLARLELEEFFQKKIYLEIFVKVQKEWQTNPAILREIGL